MSRSKEGTGGYQPKEMHINNLSQLRILSGVNGSILMHNSSRDDLLTCGERSESAPTIVAKHQSAASAYSAIVSTVTLRVISPEPGMGFPMLGARAEGIDYLL